MKLMITHDTFAVDVVPDFISIGAKNNGQHWQLNGHILADVTVGGTGEPTTFKLFHWQTDPGCGHVDVIINFGKDCTVPSFHIYSGQRFVPIEREGRQDQVWPTGGWSLIQTVLAIESFLKETVGLKPVLRGSIFGMLENGSMQFT